MSKNYPSLGEIYSGTYTPTVVDLGGNVGSVTESEAMYVKIGNTVFVNGTLTITPNPSTLGALLDFRMDLPIESDIVAGYSDLAGNITSPTFTQSGSVYGYSAAPNGARVRYEIASESTAIMIYSYMYKIQ